MEDRYIADYAELPEGDCAGLFAVYDGHGGKKCVNYLQQHLCNAILARPEWAAGDTEAACSAPPLPPPAPHLHQLRAEVQIPVWLCLSAWPLTPRAQGAAQQRAGSPGMHPRGAHQQLALPVSVTPSRWGGYITHVQPRCRMFVHPRAHGG